MKNIFIDIAQDPTVVLPILLSWLIRIFQEAIPYNYRNFQQAL